MVVDNVDDRTMFFEQRDDMTTDKCLVEYIPQGAKGSVIYTTRSRDIGVDLASGDEPIEVFPMEIDEGLLMLGDRVTRGSTREDQETLLGELAYLPLAISQATAYMAKRRRSIAEYIKLLQDVSTRTRVLDHKTLHHGRQDRSSESVTRTWWITFQWLKKENPRSAELLTMMSLLDRQQIPLALVQDTGEDIFDFEEAVRVLEAFTLIHLYSYVEVCDQEVIDLLLDYRPDLSSMSPVFCDMHRLVQASTREWLNQPENDEVHIATKTLVSVTNLMPLGNYEDFPLCRILYPHADAVLAYSSDGLNVILGGDGRISTLNMQYRASLLLKLSCYLRDQGDLALSEDRASLSVEIRRRLFGPDESEQILESMESLAMTIQRLDRHEEAGNMHRKILEARERLLGPNDRRTLYSLSFVGRGLRLLGEFAEAEKLYRRNLAGSRTLHEQDPNAGQPIEELIMALNNVADVQLCQGECEEAQTLLQEALERSQDINEREHPRTWRTRELLAMTSQQLGKYEEAHSLIAEVLAGRKEVFGETHYNTLVIRNKYTALLLQEGSYAQAEEEGRSSLEDEIRVSGVGKHSTLHNLGGALYGQKKYGEAENIYKHLLHLQEQASETKPSVKARIRLPVANATASHICIAMCLEAQGKIDEAKEYQPSAPLPPEAAIDVEEAKNLHIRSLDMYNEGQYKEAEVTARKELRVRMEHSGLENDRAQTCLLLIAQALQEQDLHSDSQSLTRQVLAYRKRVFGWRSRQTHNALRLLAAGTRDLGELEEAEGYYRQLVLWKETTYGKLYMETCIARFDLAIVLVDQRKFDEAEKLFRLNLEIHLDDPLKCDPRAIAETNHNLWLCASGSVL